MLRPLVVLLVLAATGCAAPRQVPFDPADYARFAVAGHGAIEGRASVQDETGAWRSAAGLPVQLQPLTAYAQEWHRRAVLGGEELSDADPALAPFLRTVVADADGGFRFTGLPPGEYLLTCRVTWKTAGLEGRFATHGSWASTALAVAADTTVHVTIGG